MSTGAPILVGFTDKIVWIKVEGKGSFLNSPALKEFSREMVNRGRRQFVVDLKNCPVMDSTFMGTMAGMALRLRELGHGKVHVINTNERNGDLLRNLGLNQIFSMDFADTEEIGSPQVLETDAERTETARTMLEAHEALVEADPGNLSKFKDCLAYLKEDLRRAD